MTTAEKRIDGERRLLEELDRIPELLEGTDEQTRFDLIHEAVSEVHILPNKNQRKERVVANVTFKCPVCLFWEEIPGVADGYTPMTPDSLVENNFRDDEAHVETQNVSGYLCFLPGNGRQSGAVIRDNTMEAKDKESADSMIASSAMDKQLLEYLRQLVKEQTAQQLLSD